MHKFGGACIKSKMTRYFTVDQENLKYYEDKENRNVKKTLGLAEAKATLEEKKDFDAKWNKKSIPQTEQWIEPNKLFRVGMELKGRKMLPVYFYSKELHDAKFLHANIELYGDQYKANAMPDLIELSSLIEKVTRFQRIINLMCFAQEKRFVAMHGFQ